MDKKQKIILTILAVIGLLLSVELINVFVQANFNSGAVKTFCAINEVVDCVGVARTNYSMFLGVPLALWGFILYLMIIFLLFVDKIQEKFQNTIFDVFKNPGSYIATLGLVSFFCSISLASISIFKIKMVCVLCFVTYFLDLAIAIAAKTRGSFFWADIKNTAVDFWQGVKKYTALFVVVVLFVIGTLCYTQTSMVFSPVQKQSEAFREFQNMEVNAYPATGNVLGNKDAQLKVYVFSDFMCPFCRVTNSMAHKLARKNKNIEVIHINYPLDTTCNPYVNSSIHPGACQLARYAIAAEKQGNYWGMVNIIYNNIIGKIHNEEDLLELAGKAKFDTQKLQDDVNSKEINDTLSKQIEFTEKSGVIATPSIMMTEIVYQGAMPYSEMETRVKQAQKRLERSKNTP